MLGRSLISLTSMIFCFLRASFFFFCASYLNLPKSRILQTGGSAFGAISTRSSPTLAAMRSASLRPTIPTMLPRSSTRRTRGTPISSLIRGPSRVGVKFSGILAIYALLSPVGRRLLGSQHPLRRRRNGGLPRQSSNRIAERKGFLVGAAEPADRDRSASRLTLPDDKHDRNFDQAVLANFVGNRLVSGIEDDPQPVCRAFSDHLGGIICRVGNDRGDNDLHRRQPERQAAGVVLDQNADEALDRAEDRAVQHGRYAAGAVLADIARAERFRH